MPTESDFWIREKLSKEEGELYQQVAESLAIPVSVLGGELESISSHYDISKDQAHCIVFTESSKSRNMFLEEIWRLRRMVKELKVQS